MNRAMLAFLVVIAVLLLVAFLSLFMGERRNRRRTLEEISEKWGKKGSLHFYRNVLAGLSAYSQDKGKENVDDITWRDLDLDRLYRDFNTARSSCGDCVIYDRLRHPSFSREELEEIDRLASYFDQHEEERIQLQLILSDIGRDEEQAICEQLKEAEGAEPIGGRGYVVLSLLTLADIVFFFFSPLAATLLFIPLVAVNITLSLKMKDSTEGAVTAFQALLRLLKAADEMEKLNIEAVSDYGKALKKYRNELSDFRRGAFLVTGRNRYAEGPGEAILQYIKLFFHVDLIKFDQMLGAMKSHSEASFGLMENLGFLDMTIAAASYRLTLPVWTRPVFQDTDEACLDIRDMVHPLIKNPVSNSVCLKGGSLITGSNASGKSTFLRNVAISVLMAQAFDTAPAKSYRGNFLTVMTSMALTDNLENGESYYVVEIRSLKRILEAAKRPSPLLTIVDEVLRGTNTIERIASSSQILKALLRPYVISLAATHDIELTYMLEDLYTNYHFEETIGSGDVVFDYKLKDGRSVTRNAIRLLETYDYDAGIVTAAAASAACFEETGEWKL